MNYQKYKKQRNKSPNKTAEPFMNGEVWEFLETVKKIFYDAKGFIEGKDYRFHINGEPFGLVDTKNGKELPMEIFQEIEIEDLRKRNVEK